MANTRIPQLPMAVGLDGSEELEIAQPDGFGGYVSRRATGAALQAGTEIGAAPVVLTEPYPFAAEGRVLTGTLGQISVTDGGAGNDITLALLATAVTPGTYGGSNKYTQITVDAYGRITAASEGADAGSGTVTSVSVVSANGFAGSVATATTTPAITLSTTITGILQGNGTAISAASTTGTGAVVLATSPQITTPTIVTSIAPSANDGASLGLNGKAFSDLFLASGGVINWNAGTYTLTQSGTVLTFSGSVVVTSSATADAFIPSGNTVPTDGMYLPAANTLGWAINSAAEMRLTASALSPAVSNGNALGTTSLMWADLFLASGGVINWNNGTYTATQSSTNLALSGTATLGAAAGTTGTLGLLGTTSGRVTIAPQAAAGTYNFNLPTGAGTSGQPLLSGGGGASPMTFGTLGIAGGGTGTTTGAVTVVRPQIFTSSGTYTPHANMLYCIIECVGGGGGGGGAAASGGSVSSSGAGGGAGGYSRKIASKADIGASQTVTIGALGGGGSTGNNAGSAGGDTSVGSLCIANGGSGGGGASAGGIGAKALGGVAGTGDFTPTGAGSNPGGVGVFSGTVGVIAVGSAGASSIYGGGGAGATAGVGAGNGTAATSYGSGGGGGATQNSSGGTAAGGNGSAGVVIITEFCSA